MKRWMLFLICPFLACAAPKASDGGTAQRGRESDAKQLIVWFGKSSDEDVVGKVLDPTAKVWDRHAKADFEFNGQPIDQVMRMLARKAMIDLVVSPSLETLFPKGVNLRLEKKTAKEAFEIICWINELLTEQLDGVYYVSGKFDKDTAAAKEFAHREKLRFQALLAEGFKREEALQILLRNSEAVKPAKAMNGKAP